MRSKSTSVAHLVILVTIQLFCKQDDKQWLLLIGTRRGQTLMLAYDLKLLSVDIWDHILTVNLHTLLEQIHDGKNIFIPDA